MANKEQYLSRDGVSHLYLLIKNKLTTYFKTLFVSKRDGYDLSQNDFTNELKRKLENMSGGGGTGSLEGAVLYTEQTLTDEEKTQARDNIGTTDGTWESMPDKPFGYYTTDQCPTITWNGDISGRVGVQSTIMGMNCTYYKVAEWDNTNEAYYNKAILTSFGEAETIDIACQSLNNGLYISGMQDEEGAIIPLIVWSFVSDYGAELNANTIFTEKGIYFAYVEGSEMGAEGYMCITSIKAEFLKPIDKVFLPDDIKVELPEGIVTTDENGLIPASVLPSYVDDVVEGYYNVNMGQSGEFYQEYDEAKDMYSNLIYSETGKIYVDLHTSTTYRWSGSQYVKIESASGLTALTNTEIDEIIASVDSSTE